MMPTDTLTSPPSSVDLGVVVVPCSRDGTGSDGMSTSGGRVGSTGRGTGSVGVVVLSESEDHCGCLSWLV